MKTTDIRKLIAKSPSADWFNSLELTTNFSRINVSEKLKGLGAIHRYFSTQQKGWGKYEDLPSELQTSKNFFNQNVTQIESFVNTYTTQPEGVFTQQWNQLRSQLTRNGNFFTYDCAQTEFLLNLFSEKPNSVTGAYNFLIGTYQMRNKNEFIGAMLAYEFELKDFTELANRRNKEKSSIISLRTQLTKKVNEIENQLDEHLLEANKRFEDYSHQIDSLKKSKEELFDSWFEKSKKDHFDFETISSSSIKSLEEIYKEKLKLEEPAKYWETRGSKLQTQGWKAFWVLLVSIILVAITLISILWNVPEDIYKSFFSSDKSSAIRWSIVYLTLLSFLAYGIRAISKIMFSSFHLARDAQERYTLTYFYLSLLKDSNVEKDEKQLIMQSLFSRSDTGLLKEDSSPTMPNDVVSKLIGK